MPDTRVNQDLSRNVIQLAGLHVVLVVVVVVVDVFVDVVVVFVVVLANGSVVDGLGMLGSQEIEGEKLCCSAPHPPI